MLHSLNNNQLIPNRTRSRIWLTGLGIAVLFYLLLGMAFRLPFVTPFQPHLEPSPSDTHTITLGNLHLTLSSNHSPTLTWHQTFIAPANPSSDDAWLSSQQGHIEFNRE